MLFFDKIAWRPTRPTHSRLLLLLLKKKKKKKSIFIYSYMLVQLNQKDQRSPSKKKERGFVSLSFLSTDATGIKKKPTSNGWKGATPTLGKEFPWKPTPNIYYSEKVGK